MDYQAYQLQMEAANTAHQREVRDLQAAGLNPILSAHSSGAASPTPVAGGDEAVNKAISGALKIANTAVRNSAKTAHAAVQAAKDDSTLTELLPLAISASSESSPSSAETHGFWNDLLKPVRDYVEFNRNRQIGRSGLTVGMVADLIQAVGNHSSVPGVTSGRTVDSMAQANHQYEAERRSAGFARASARTRSSNIYRELQEQASTARALLGRAPVRSS